MALSDRACWSALSDVAWYFILKQLTWRDIGHCRAACRSWRRDVDRCLQRLHLRDPTHDCLTRLGSTFARLSTVKVTAVHKRGDVRMDELSELPGALGRAGALRLRSKRPGGGVMAVGQLQLLRSAGSVLTVLSLRSCEVTSWLGLEGCQNLAHLHLIHCRFSEAACLGLTSALAALPRLAFLELRCTVGRVPRRSVDGTRFLQQPSNHLQHHQHHHHHHHHHHQRQHHQHHQHHMQQQQQQQEYRPDDGYQHHPHHQYPTRQHQHYLPQLVDLGSCAPHLAVLKLAAPLPEAALQGLLRLELPNIYNLRELDLELHPAVSVRQSPLEHGHALPNGSSSATVSYRELSALIPAISVGAPHLTSLRIKGHSRVQDRDLQLLQPLRHLRQLSLDLSHTETMSLRPLPPPPPQQQQQQQQALAHANADWSSQPPPSPLSSTGVASLLQGPPGLQALSLSYSSWCPEGLRCLSDSTSLTQLRLAGVELPKGFTLCNFLYSFRSLRNLVDLDLGGCAGLTDWGLALLGRCAVQLRSLNVGGCGELAGDVGVAALAPLMARLQRLDLSSMDKLTDRGLAGLLRNGAPALQFLFLDYCSHIQDAGVHSVAAGCPSLQHLGLDYCVRVSAVGASALRKLRELRRLSVEGCIPAVQTTLAGLPAVRPKRSHAASRWWLAADGGM
ncbi:hypothetical protein Vretimale_16565 [Volvox reticuliferus]|uniref:F-box/LRR-repeat protein 15-like leucin rich repeat domain-containing protein n=1 Tax=Volvox reticuliferus TaxID=1737510 RepID=A0A8J4CW04_9CHLO|nr:hypothetical protein Vretifemale_17563 [Volvox reticuliferus]GIM13456.1 hypothetical protein Vretimale_16565 [Volvox reticuliferus]